MFSILQEALASDASGAGGPSAPGLMSWTRVPRPSRLRVEPEAGELLTCLPVEEDVSSGQEKAGL